MLLRSSVLGRTPASDSLLALTKTMQRIGVSPFVFSRSRVFNLCSLPLTSNEIERDRHGFDFFAAYLFVIVIVVMLLAIGIVFA
jgi:hypothetical protein